MPNYAPIGSPITHIVVHYSATQRGQNVTVADITQWHRARNFIDIGYHYVIYLDGSVHTGRPLWAKGAGVKGQNTGKIHICWIGGIDGDPDVGVDTRTHAQTLALRKLIDELLARYPDAQVVGHRDLAPTQCPGFDVAAWWAYEVEGPNPNPLPPLKDSGFGPDDDEVTTNVPTTERLPEPTGGPGSAAGFAWLIAAAFFAAGAAVSLAWNQLKRFGRWLKSRFKGSGDT